MLCHGSDRFHLKTAVSVGSALPVTKGGLISAQSTESWRKPPCRAALVWKERLSSALFPEQCFVGLQVLKNSYPECVILILILYACYHVIALDGLSSPAFNALFIMLLLCPCPAEAQQKQITVSKDVS